jgi:hypothetical protein
VNTLPIKLTLSRVVTQLGKTDSEQWGPRGFVKTGESWETKMWVQFAIADKRCRENLGLAQLRT